MVGLPYTDAFTGADGSPLSSAWTAQNHVTIVGNKARLRPTDAFQWAEAGATLGISPLVTDVDAILMVLTGASGDAHFTLSINVPSGGTPKFDNGGYSIYLFSVQAGVTEVSLTRTDGTGTTSLNDTAYPSGIVAPNNPINVRLQRAGSTIRYRLWPSQQAEPAAWTFETTDPVPLPAGTIKLGAQNSTAVFGGTWIDADNITVTVPTGGTTPPPGTTSTDGYIKAWSGSAWVPKPIKAWNGSAWVQKPLKRWNGSAWVLVTGGTTGGTSTGGGGGGGTPGPSGTPTPNGPSGTWNLIFQDEFDAPTLNTTVWNTHNGATVKNVTMSTANVSIVGSSVNLKLSGATSGAEIYTNSNLFLVGDYLEVRAKFPGNGTNLYNWPAVQTSGPNWPADGEIDVAEVLGASGALTSNYHYGTVSSPLANFYGGPAGYWGDTFHTFGVYRKATSFDIYWDGVLVQSNRPTTDSGAGQNIVLNMGVGQGPTSVGAVLVVDYVRTFRPASTGGGGTGIPASGVAMPVGNLNGWTQFLAQDFNTNAALGSFASVYPNWSRYDGLEDTSARDTSRPAGQAGMYDSTTTSSVHDGMFDGFLHTDGVRPKVFALTPPNQGGTGVIDAGNIHGRYSVRFYVTPGIPRYKVAWLLWPDSDTWAEGEIDFPEADLDSTIQGYSHDVTGTPANNAFAIDSGVQIAGGWHTCTTEWTPTSVKFTLDGQSWSTTSSSAIPTHSMHWVLQTETWIDSQTPSPTTTGHIYIDWVVGYRYTPGVIAPAGTGSGTAALTGSGTLRANGSVSSGGGSASLIPAWDHVVVVVFENHSQSQVYGAGSYFTTLADQNAYMTSSFAVSHPSLPNYLALWSGSTQGVSDDNDYNFSSSVPHLGSQMAAAGKTFKGYSEDLPSVGYTGSTSGDYARKHAPWVSWQANGGFNGNLHVPYTQWPTDFTTLPKLAFVIPNLIDDIHDSNISTGASWFQANMLPYLTWAKAHNSLLITTFDEDDDTGGNNSIYTVFGGAHVATGRFTQTINHYSVLGLLQDWLGLSRIAGSVGKAQITTPWN